MVWWSFYESDATVSKFIRETLAYVTGQPEETPGSLPAQEAEAQLLAALRARPYLLVLDGIERILVAYHRMDAPQVNDEEVEEADKKQAEDVRCCTDPRHAEFLQKLTACAPSKVLISTRLFPRDLADRHDAHRPLPGVAHLHLNGLHPDDAVALIRHRGVNGKAADLKPFMAQFGYHSLLIGAVAGRIANYFPAPGDFAAWHADEGKTLRLDGDDLKVKRTHILHYALDGLSPEQAKLLSQIAAFRYPVDYAALSALNPYLPPKPEEVEEPREPRSLGFTYAQYKLNEAETDKDRQYWQAEVEKEKAIVKRQKPGREARYAEQQAAYAVYQAALRTYKASPELREARSRFHVDLSALEARGLLQWDRAANRYDLHPVVRGYAFERLEGDDRSATFEHIRDYFAGLPPEHLETAQEVGDLRCSLEIYHALIGAGWLYEAARFYGAGLSTVLQLHLAAYPLMIELLTPLFPDGLDRLPALGYAGEQRDILIDMANALYYTDQIEQALVLENLMIGLDLEREHAPDLNSSLSNYTNSLRAVNHLAAALRALELARDLAKAAGDTDGMAKSYVFLLGGYRDTGQWTAAEEAYRRFNEAPPSYQREYWQAGSECYWAEALVLRGLDASEALDRAWALSTQGRNQLGQHLTLRLRGEVALQAGQPDAAAGYFEEAITLARKSGLTNEYLGELARARAAQGRHAEARGIIEDLLQAATKDEDKPHLSAAEVYLALGETDLARQHALRAYEEAWADGPPFVWWWSLQRAKAVLAALGEPEPSLPPFDPAKVEPIPHEAEIRAFIEKLRAEKAASGEEDAPES